MGNFEIAVLVGWAIAVWALCSVLFSDPSKFSNLGRSKWRWFLIELTAFTPYFGFIAVLFYVFKVRMHFPPRTRQPDHASPTSSYGTVGSPGRSSSSSSSSSSRASNWTASTANNTMGSRLVEKCGSCGGSGKQTCFSCQGRGRITIPAYAHNAGTSEGWCTPCSGSGKRSCDSCGGSGVRR
jgi:hypothetical protein